MESKVKGSVFTYPQFIEWVEQLVQDGKTSGDNQTDDLISFTALNLKRMQRIDKTMQMAPELMNCLRQLDPQRWWVITEAWCGDSAQSLPVIGAMAANSGGVIDLNIMLRDENPAIMDDYLTNGGKSIPKLVVFDNAGNELFTWGPRPKSAQEILLSWKNNPNGKSWEEFERELHGWYTKNKQQEIQAEFVQLLS